MKIEFEVTEQTVKALDVLMAWLTITQRKPYEYNVLAHDVLMQFVENNIIKAIEILERRSVGG